MQRAHEILGKNGVTVLAIALDGTGAKDVQPFVAKNKFTVPVAVDPDMAVARAFEVRAVPTTVVVARDGSIAARGFGPLDLDDRAVLDYVRAVAARR